MKNQYTYYRNLLLAILVIIIMQTIAVIYFEAVSFRRMENITRIIKENSFFEYIDFASDIDDFNWDSRDWDTQVWDGRDWELMNNTNTDNTDTTHKAIEKLNSKNRDITKA